MTNNPKEQPDNADAASLHGVVNPPLTSKMASVAIPIPRSVAECPECGGELSGTVVEWDSETGIPTTTGIQVDCENEPSFDEDSGDPHRWCQSDWQPVIDCINKWAGAVDV